MDCVSAPALTRPRTTSLARRLAGALLSTFVATLPAHADVLLDTTRTATTAAPAVERTLTVSQAATLEVEVVDQATPAALGAIRAVVTRADTIVGTPLTAAGKITFDAAANTDYVIRVFGRPATGQPSGVVGVRVTRATDPQPRTSLLDFVGAFAGTAAANPLNLTLEVPLTIPEAGTYTATLSDFQFPAAASSVSAFIFLGSQPVAQVAAGTPATFTAVATTPGSPTQYKVVLSANASTTARAALFGLKITGGPSNNVVYDATTPVGALEAPEAFTNPTAGSLTLQVRDAAFPAALTQVGAVVTSGGSRVGNAVFGTGSATLTAPAGALRLWTTGTAGATPGIYQATVSQTAGPTLVTRLRAVSSTATNAPTAYLFPVTLTTAGAYRARVTDFQFPSSLQSVQFAVLQNGTPLAQTTAAGTLDFNGSAGAAQLFVVAQPPTGGSGLFGAEILTTGTTVTNVLDQTQGVGAAFDAREIVVTTAGRYDVSLKDVAWPAAFQNLALAVTRGGQVAGKIFGGGTFFFDATPGRYLATLVATPSATEAAGLYSVKVQSTAPTVTLTANPTSITSGQTTTLSWTSTAATACTASGTWSGTKATGTGTETQSPTANATYTLTCTGPGGSATASASVTVTPAPGGGGSGGGGGEFGLESIALLGSLLALRGAFARRRGAGVARADD